MCSSDLDLRKIFEDAQNLLKLTGRKTILFVDEIQRFSKSQQDNVRLVPTSSTPLRSSSLAVL